MVNLVKHDLEFILKQIEIAEAHAAGGDLAALVAGYGGNDGLAQAHLLPYGLRTVDGSYNNLLPGRTSWGASDQSFPGLFDPTYLNDQDGDRYDFNPAPNGPGVDGIMGTADDTGVSWYTNTNYAYAGTRTGSQPGPGSGTVIDADPRVISNLIVDQTLNNPAAIAAALTHAGMSGQPLMAALSDINNAHTILKGIPAPVGDSQPSSAYSLAKAALDAKLAHYGVEMDGNTVLLPNVSPDEGLSSPFNGWMTIFGQFFDHGLDLVAKGGNGTVYVPLALDDPLYVPGGQNYIPLTRVTVNAGVDGVLGVNPATGLNDDGVGPRNLTTPWVDQNQTYGSTASKQVFMREYVPGPDGKPIATGLLLEGSNGGLATWADIKTQARDVLGINLTDANVGNIPLVAADEYGNFIPGPNGYPQLVEGMGPDGLLGTADDVLREGDPSAPVSAQGVVLTGHAFIDDIAHAAVPVAVGGVLQADTDSALGYSNEDGTPGPQGQRGPTAYDDELLDRHFIAGDGRANENIALTAVHQIFHSEHNRVVEMTKQIALTSGDLAFLNEWLLVDVAAMPTTEAEKAALVWDGERLFQAGRFTNEMEYQHLVFEEFGRMIQPDIDVFVFEPSADINPAIAAEFAHVVYRFGHSMLRQDIAIIAMDENGKPTDASVKLFDGFLNPVMYDSLGDAEAASGAIIRGMSRQTGSEIDEFVTDVLRNQLLGIPLDLATINLARGRDVGTPPLNAAREKFFDATGDTLLKPYESWADYALNLKNPASIINFIAAYGTHDSLLNTQANPKTVEELRDAATKLVLGDSTLTGQAKIDFDNDRFAFLNAEGEYAGGTLGGLNTVDLWVGGLAEKKMAFGGMLGSTFSFVFQMTMENLQDADRFYYLSRTQGLNLLNELENNTFAELAMRNTDLGDAGSTALPGNLFSAFQMPTLEMDISKQIGNDPVSDDPFLGGIGSKLVERVDANGDGVAETIRVNSNEHFTIGGTEGNDTIVSGGGDDAIWGRGGNDRIEAGYGVDKVFGGAGHDIITNAGTDIGEADFLHGNEGNDVIHGGSGLSLLFGNEGSDFIVTGPDGKEAFAGTGNDFVLGGSGGDVLLGNEGNDWLEGGQRFDTLAGENSELFFNSSIVGHDVLNGGSGDVDYDGESGDDIMFQNSEGIQRSNGMAGFDWAIHKGDSQAANSDLGIPIFATQEAFILRDRFDLVEGLSGWKNNDTLTGRITAVNTRAELEGTAAIPGPDSILDSYSSDLLAKNVGLINGLNTLVAHLGTGIPVTKVVDGQTVPVLDENGQPERVIFSTADASDILLGGGGSDVVKGLAGNDVIDGDRWLNVRIAIRANIDGTGPTIATTDGLTEKIYSPEDYVNGAPKAGATPLFGGRSLSSIMFDAVINPGQLQIVREIVDGKAIGDVDTAVYTDAVANYDFGTNSDGSLFVSHTRFVAPQQDDGLPEAEGGPDVASDGKDTIRNIEKLQFVGSTLNVIEGGDGAETLGGTADADLLVGKGDNDVLTGLAGNDILIGGTGNDAMTGGSGDDTYVIGLGAGNDTINETSAGGAADRIVIQAAGAVLTGLDAADNNTGTNTGSLVIGVNGESITVANHFGGTNAQTGVELINFDGATYEGYGLGDEDYLVSRADPAGAFFGLLPRTIDLSGSTANNFVAGESGSETIVGGAGNDLIFGAGGDNTIDGGAGNDLLVGGAGSDDLVGGLGSDTMVGGGGNDLYVVDDDADVVVEASNGGSDQVETDLAAYTLSANVENLAYTGAGSFAGTGNNLGNRIEGGAGVDTLSGLGGDDTYVITAGDIVIEAADGGTDTILSDASYTLGATLENLTLTGNGAISGAGNGAANTILGNSAANQLFGGGGIDTISGLGGDDVIDGGTGDDFLNGGDGNDTIIGGEGNDVIDVGAGFNRIVYNAAGFGSDIINSFDADGGLTTNQDKIDLSGFGVTAVNFAQRVVETAVTGGRLLSVNDEAGNQLGAIQINGVTDAQIDSSDFILAAAAPAPVGTPTDGPNAITGTAAANTINGLGGNDTLNGLGGDDVINGGEGADTLNGGDGNDTLAGGQNIAAVNYVDNFDAATAGNSNGGAAWGPDWVESGDSGGVTTGQIRIDGGNNNVLQFIGGTGANFNGAQITRTVDLAGATAATLSYSVAEFDLDAGDDTIAVLFARDGINFVQVDSIDGATSDAGNLGRNIDLSLFGTGPFTANAAVRFVASSLEAGDTVNIDNLTINATGSFAVDTINGDAGDDTIIWNANVSGATDGRDLINGGTEGAVGDTLVINGNADAESYRIYTRAAFDAVQGNTLNGINAGTEIIITRNGTDAASIIAELREIEEIRLNSVDPAGATGEAGGDTFQIIGDFSSTSLRLNTITIDGDAGDDTIDVSALTSAHRIVFKSNGGNDTILGTLRPQDVVELAPGKVLDDYEATQNANGTTTLSSGGHSVTFLSSGTPTFQGAPGGSTGTPGGGSGTPSNPSGGFAITASDLAALKNLVNGIGMDGGPGGVRTLGGDGNNVDNPTWSSADQPFIRLTEARYGEYDEATGNRAINPIFDGLDPRAISNIIGDQEVGLPKAQSEANIFFMAFGQYFDHGLDFLPKGGNGVIEIGGPGAERAPGTDNPADLTRGTVAFIDADGVPQHMNKTSPFVDQNQAYGSHGLVGQFLREGDGEGGLTAHLFAGAPDPSAPQFRLLPTLRELINEHWENDTVFHSAAGDVSFRTYYAGLVGSDGAIDGSMVSAMASNFMGSGHALLLDTNPFQNLLDHYVAGDGRANENFALTSMHTVWARNHNFHVENLEAAGFEGTPEELFQAAKVLNEAEYARVVFDEFADALLGGMRGSGTHGDSGYNPEANAGISHEFAAAVYRLGHSLVGQTMTVLDENGQPKQVALFDAFLNPSNDASSYTAPLPPGYVPQPGYNQLGVGNILGGIVTQQAEEVDVNIVDAIRSDLVRINADLFSFNVARSWDVGLGTLNQIRMGLQASQDPYVREAIGFAGDLTPYASWEDFQTRNGLSDTVIGQFKQAYPDLVLQDSEEIAAFQAINPEIELVDGNTVKGIDRVDPWVGGLAEKHINGGVVGQTFWVVLHEQFDRLQEGDRFYYTDRLDNLDLYENIIDGQSFSDIVARNTGLTGLSEDIFFVDEEDDGETEQPGGGQSNPIPGTGAGDDDEDEDEDDGAPTTGGGDEDEDEDEDEDVDLPPTGGSGDEDEDEGASPTPSPSAGTPTAPRVGTVNADVLVGSALSEDIIAFAGDDVITAGDGDDTVSAGEGADFVRAGAGRDMVFAGAGDDQVFAEDGADLVYGEAGNDRIFAGAGNDLVDAGAGDDTVFGGTGNDLFLASIGDGADTYYGDDQDGAAGVDTLDMSAILANVTVDLGAGSRGTATSAQSGTDILWSIENVITGGGNDTITAGIGVNVLDGGDGNDTFRFESVAAINGDRILGFEPGDKIDLSAIDANYGAAGDQGFSIGTALTGAGQLTITHETGQNGQVTVVQGNVDGDNAADFRLEIQGHHTLTNQNFGF